jgi:hypothetical protein
MEILLLIGGLEVLPVGYLRRAGILLLPQECTDEECVNADYAQVSGVWAMQYVFEAT